jgi:hypothetical protein
MVNLPMVGGTQARRILDAVFPAFGKWDHVVNFTVRQAVSCHELWVAAAWHLAAMSGARTRWADGKARMIPCEKVVQVLVLQPTGSGLCTFLRRFCIEGWLRIGGSGHP